MAASASLAAADPPPSFVILDRSLTASDARSILSISDSKVEYISAAGQTVSVPRESVLALAPWLWWHTGATEDPASTDHPVRSLLELTDGSRLYGSPVPDAAGPGGAARGGDALVWTHANLGRVAFKLDRVRRIALASPDSAPPRPTAPPTKPPAKDSLTLTNADRLDGFFVGLSESDAEPVARLESDATVRATPLSRVSEITLVNPATPPARVRLWLEDGSVAPAASLVAGGPGSFTVRLDVLGADSVAPVEIPVRQIRAAVLDSSRLRPLSTLPLAAQTPAKGRRWSPAATVAPGTAEPLDAGEVTLPGPGVYEWTLPVGADRAAGEMVLPESCRTWGDCFVVLSVVAPDGTVKELSRAHVNGESPAAGVNAVFVPAVNGSRLRVTIDEGAYGPVQDRVTLVRMFVAGGGG